MRTVWQVFLRDCKRILRNPVAAVVTLGVAVLPSLYAWFNIYGCSQIVQTMIFQGGKIKFLTDLLQHLLVVRGIRICIVRKDLVIYILSLSLRDHSPGDQIHLGFGTGEIQIFTIKQAAGDEQDGYVLLSHRCGKEILLSREAVYRGQ